MPTSQREGTAVEGPAMIGAPPGAGGRAWGIDIGRAAIKALLMGYDVETERAVALGFDVVEYPDALTAPPSKAKAAVAAAVEQFRDRNELEDCRIAVAAAGRADLTRFLELPRVTAKRLRSIVRYEADLHIPVHLDKAVWDYQMIAGPDEAGASETGMAHVGLSALTRDQVTETLAPLQSAGILPELLQSEPLALSNYLGFDRGFELRDDRALVLIDVGAACTDLLILFGTRHWRRVIPIGGNHFSNALARRLKLGFAKAEHFKCNLTRIRDPQAALDAMSQVYDDLINQLERSVTFFSRIYSHVRIGRTLLLGGGSKLPGFQQLLPREFGAAPERLDRFERLSGDEILSAPMFREHFSSFGVAYGLSIQALGLGRWNTNLLPPEQRPRKGWSFAGFFERIGRVRVGR